jgi:hypothetical protein
VSEDDLITGVRVGEHVHGVAYREVAEAALLPRLRHDTHLRGEADFDAGDVEHAEALGEGRMDRSDDAADANPVVEPRLHDRPGDERADRAGEHQREPRLEEEARWRLRRGGRAETEALLLLQALVDVRVGQLVTLDADSLTHRAGPAAPGWSIRSSIGSSVRIGRGGNR